MILLAAENMLKVNFLTMHIDNKGFPIYLFYIYMPLPY